MTLKIENEKCNDGIPAIEDETQNTQNQSSDISQIARKVIYLSDLQSAFNQADNAIKSMHTALFNLQIYSPEDCEFLDTAIDFFKTNEAVKQFIDNTYKSVLDNESLFRSVNIQIQREMWKLLQKINEEKS